MRDRFCPECRWTVVTDGNGRRHLEMRWVPSSTGRAQVAPAA